MELKDVLGASGETSAQRFSLYLPEKDRDGAPVLRHEDWMEAAMTIFADVNGGATRLPTAQGIWKPETGKVVREATSVVYSFVRDTGAFEAGLNRLARFIHTFGKHANQGEVMVEFAGEVPGRGFVSRAYFIDDYAKAGPARLRGLWQDGGGWGKGGASSRTLRQRLKGTANAISHANHLCRTFVRCLC